MHVISLLLILVIMVQLAILRLPVPYLGRSHDTATTVTDMTANARHIQIEGITS